MDPITMSLIMGGLQTGIGALQRRSANRRRERAMADMRYDIPSAVTEQVQNARARASQTGLPGEDVTRARLDSQLAQTTERGESVSESTSDVLGLYAKLYGQRSDANMQLLERGAQYKDMNEIELNKALGLMAEAEGQQFYYNRFVPFLSDMQYASEESQGGAMNIASGLNTAYSGWMNKWQMDEMAKLYGNTGTPTEGVADTLANRQFVRNYGNLETENPMQMEPWMIDSFDQGSTTGQPVAGKPVVGQGGNPSWQSLPEWQKNNPVSYPPSWLKYR